MTDKYDNILFNKKPDEKICPICGIKKPKTKDFFRLRSRYKNVNRDRYEKDFSSYCITCLNDAAKINSKLHYERNKEAINKRQREWYQENNREKFLQLRRRNERKKRLNNPKKVISDRMSARIRGYLSKGVKNNRSWVELVGYTPEELMKHLENKFVDGMGWHNRCDWHIDHIRPISSFEFSSPEDKGFKECWALDNLQPLWADENIKKRNNWDSKINV